MRSWLILGVVMTACSSVAMAQAEERVVFGAGSFTLKKSSATIALQAGYYFSLEPDQFFEMGGELQYRTLKTTVFGVPDVDITSISVPGIIVLKPVPPPIIPYVGIGVIFGYSTFDKSSVEARQPGLTVTDPTASSFGFLLLSGLRIQFESGISFFGEFRYGWDSFSVEFNGQRSSVSQSGSWLLGGMGIDF